MQLLLFRENNIGRRVFGCFPTKDKAAGHLPWELGRDINASMTQRRLMLRLQWRICCDQHQQQPSSVATNVQSCYGAWS